MNEFRYQGSELDLFSSTNNWKKYLYECINPFLGREVLEVGAGIGSATKALARGKHGKWICLEPDAHLLSELKTKIENGLLPHYCRSFHGKITELHQWEKFDTILYIDVLEHIEDDKAEIKEAASRLKKGGFLVILSPAHQWLYSPFDRFIGHYRRYNQKMLRKIGGKEMNLTLIRYLDAIGLLASLANSMLLRQDMPTQHQIDFWDRHMVSISRFVDPLFGYFIGKSILGVLAKL